MKSQGIPASTIEYTFSLTAPQLTRRQGKVRRIVSIWLRELGRSEGFFNDLRPVRAARDPQFAGLHQGEVDPGVQSLVPMKENHLPYHAPQGAIQPFEPTGRAQVLRIPERSFLGYCLLHVQVRD